VREYRKFREGIEKTALYLRTLYQWRDCWWLNRSARDLTGEERASTLSTLREATEQLMSLFDEWQRYREEAGFWRVTFRYGQPDLSPNNVFPWWYPHGDETMETSAREFV
jgi:hypothetical protein